MPTYKYTAIAPDGTPVKGETEAATATSARLALIDRELHVTEVAEKKSILQTEITKKKIKRSEIMHFSRQLAAFIRAGVPLLDAIDVIAQETGDKVLHRVLQEVEEALRSGQTLSEAMAAHGEHFPAFYIDMLRSAELTGRLDTILDQLAKYIERDLEAKRKIRSAMTYPMVILIMAIGTVGILTAFVMPRFQQFFESFDARLPLPTRMLLAVTHFITDWWWLLMSVTGALFFGIVLALQTEKGKHTRDRILLRLPVIGDVVRYATVERFCRTLSAMIEAGVPIPDAIRVSSDTSSNRVFQYALSGAREAMLEGEGLARPIARTELFPSSVVQMIRVGEDTGTLDQQLTTAADYFEQELGYKIKKFTSLFEPAVIIVMGLLVGFVAVALVSAMYGIFSHTGKI